MSWYLPAYDNVDIFYADERVQYNGGLYRLISAPHLHGATKHVHEEANEVHRHGGTGIDLGVYSDGTLETAW